MVSNFWGIDFGTTTTYLSSSSNSYDKLVHIGRLGDPFIPSVAAFDDEELLFCEETKNIDERYKIRSIKYMITRGTGIQPADGVTESKEIDRGQISLISQPHGKPNGQWMRVESRLGPQEVRVENIISGILRTLKARADLVQESAEEARMGCPAMWDGNRRRRLLEIAKESGIQVTDGTLIDEPIAACLNWLDQNRMLVIEGNVLIFDMGGGTLDVSVIHVKANPGSAPTINVLSSYGISEAGNEFDDAIAEAVSSKFPGEMDKKLLSENYGWLRELAKRLKEQLLDSKQVSGTLVLPNLPGKPVQLSRQEIKKQLEPQMERAMDLVYRSIRAGLVTLPDKVASEDSSGRKWIEIVQGLGKPQLLKNINHFVLAGGMAQMPLLKEFLIDKGVDNKIIDFADNNNPAEAIAKGLATENIFGQMSLHLPSFSFYLEWRDENSGEPKRIELYQAHTPLVSVSDAVQGFTYYYYHFDQDIELPKWGSGEIIGRSVDGLPITFSLSGVKLQGLPFDFGRKTDPVFRIARAGGIFVRDTAGRQKYYNISSWPLVRNISSSIIPVDIKIHGEDRNSPWWSDYSNMRP